MKRWRIPFELCIRRKEPLQKLESWLINLKDALDRELNSRHPEARHFKWYVSRIKERSGRFRSELWIGGGIPHFKNNDGKLDPRCGVQFQFGIGQSGVWTNGIWIEGTSLARHSKDITCANMSKAREDFLRKLTALGDDYRVYSSDRNGVSGIDKPCSEIDLADLNELINHVHDRNRYVQIYKPILKKDRSRWVRNLPKVLASTYSRLWDLYRLMTLRQRHSVEETPMAGAKKDRRSVVSHEQASIPQEWRLSRKKYQDPLEKREKSVQKHREIERSLFSLLTSKVGKRNPSRWISGKEQPDITCTWHDTTYIFEVKSCVNDARHQVRYGIGQLFEYGHFAIMAPRKILVLVLGGVPLNSDREDWLTKILKIHVLYYRGKKFVPALGSAETLSWLF